MKLAICQINTTVADFSGNVAKVREGIAWAKKKGAQLLINISASPFCVGIQKTRRELLSKTAGQNQIPVIYCNMVGGNDELVFDGGSLVADANGKICLEAKRFEEDFRMVDLARMPHDACRMTDKPVEEIYHALILGLKDYLRKCGFKKVVMGLSGGIDSTVVACLAQKALGSKNVLGVSLPSPYSSKASLDDAKALAKKLKIKYRVIPITKIYEEYLKTMKIDVRKKVPLAAENIQARIRGNILMALSNQTGAMVLSTGNKSEITTGYCTLYGDLAGGLALLSDLPKTTVYDLTRWINKKHKIIDASILKKPPSAELRPNQKDEESLPPYSVLDEILKGTIEKHLSPKEIVALGISKKRVKEVLKRVNLNEYKRRQAPPGIKVTSKAFGIGRRFPIAWKYL